MYHVLAIKARVKKYDYLISGVCLNIVNTPPCTTFYATMWPVLKVEEISHLLTSKYFAIDWTSITHAVRYYKYISIDHLRLWPSRLS